jgi:bifunctional ADP-heptose synthase (sugar kinase/adenylyltransferase)
VDGYKLFQLDQRDDRAVSEAVGDQVLAQVKEALPDTDVVVISDYRHGLLSSGVVGGLMPLLHSTGKAVYVDSQVSQTASNHTLYSGGCVLCLNLREARCIDPGFTPALDATAFEGLNKALDSTRILVKLGEDGAMFQDGSRVTQSPADKVSVTDTTGAGDAFLSAFSLSGLDSPESALRLANTWAGLSVQIHGTIPPRKADLLSAIEKQ